MKDETLYVNLTDEQCKRLDDIEKAVQLALEYGCKPRDVLDSVKHELSVAQMKIDYIERTREAAEEMAAEADDYNPEAEVAELSCKTPKHLI